MSAIVYHLLIKPISFLPYPLLYLLSDIVSMILYYVISFRKKVIRGNLTRSFPAMDVSEIKIIERKFYKHLADVFLESLKLFSISENQLRKRFIKRNPQVLNRFYEEGKSVIIVGVGVSTRPRQSSTCYFQIKHTCLGIYSPFHNKYFKKKSSESRSRFGVILVPHLQVKRYMIRYQDQLTATIYGIDQSPTSRKNIFWNTFLNQDTAWFVGAEKYAREFNYPVVYTHIIKAKRGYYEMEFKVIEENPGNTAEGEIIEKYVRYLEQKIVKKPEFWLWSHRRWKCQLDKIN